MTKGMIAKAQSARLIVLGMSRSIRHSRIDRKSIKLYPTSAEAIHRQASARSLGYLYLLEAKSFMARRSRVVAMNTSADVRGSRLLAERSSCHMAKRLPSKTRLGESPRVAKSDRTRQTARLVLRGG